MATSYDQWKLASPPEYDLPDFQDEQGKIAAEKIEEIEIDADAEASYMHTEEGKQIVFAEAMEEILCVLMDLDDDKFYEQACEAESERCEPDPDRAYDSRFDD